MFLKYLFLHCCFKSRTFSYGILLFGLKSAKFKPCVCKITIKGNIYSICKQNVLIYTICRLVYVLCITLLQICLLNYGLSIIPILGVAATWFLFNNWLTMLPILGVPILGVPILGVPILGVCNVKFLILRLCCMI